MTISKLPDLALLEVFAHVPLLDLLNNIPLVCSNWHRLQRSTLLRRKRLYLLPMYANGFGFPHLIRHLEQDVLGQPSVELINNPNLDWCLTSTFPCFDLEEDYGSSGGIVNKCTPNSLAYLHNALPLPSDAPTGSEDDQMDHLPGLSSPETVRLLANRLPNLTELTVMYLLCDSVSNSVLFLDHITQLIQCYSPSLTVLRLHLQVADGEMHSNRFQQLVSVIDTQLPRLHSLQLSFEGVTLNTYTKLSARLMSQLWLFVYSPDIECNLLRSKELKTMIPNERMDSSFVIFHRQMDSSSRALSPPSDQPLNAPHTLRLLRMNIFSMEDLCRACDHFQGLTSLQITILFDNQSLTELWAALATLPSLTRLCLDETSESTLSQPHHPATEPQTQGGVVLGALRHLSLSRIGLGHQQIGRLLPNTGCFPVLEHVHFLCSPHQYPWYEETCVQAMLSYLNHCPRLRAVCFGPLVNGFTRTGASEAFHGEL